MRIVGDSMAPLMTSGDRVLVKLGAEVERETVIVARHPDHGYVCKRVAKVSRDRIELGAAGAGPRAITIPRLTELIVGTVVMVSRGPIIVRGCAPQTIAANGNEAYPRSHMNYYRLHDKNSAYPDRWYLASPLT